MSANRLFFMTVVLLGLGALVAGCGSDTVSPTDEAPILPPENLTASASGESVTLNWNPSPHPRLAGYTVYRVQMDTHDQVKLTVGPIQTTTYTDDSVRRGVAYEYQVTAVTKAGKESVCASIAAILRLSAHDPGLDEN
jgi:fibronectin type 3 domain-containing protein